MIQPENILTLKEKEKLRLSISGLGIQELSSARPNHFNCLNCLWATPRYLEPWQGRQRARELMESGSLHFKAVSLGNVSRARKSRLPEKHGPRGLDFELLISSESELLDRWAGTWERGVKQGERGKQGVSHPNFIVAVTQLHFQEYFELTKSKFSNSH